MYRTKTKIWTGLGAVVISTGTLQAADMSGQSGKDDSQSPFNTPVLKAEYLSAGTQPLYVASKGGYGGEGGEGGEAGAAAAGADPDEAYMTELMLMRGHLRIGKALVEQDNWDDAVMHFLHPVEEIYGQLEGDLRQRGVRPFRGQLDELARTVKQQAGREPFDTAFNAVQTALDQAITALPDATRHQPTFRLNVALRLLQQAAIEYNAAITDGRIVNVAEYQDSRGFVWTAEELLNSVATELEERDAEAWNTIQSLLADIKQAWPGVEPPAKPVQPVSRVLSNISRISLQASQLR